MADRIAVAVVGDFSPDSETHAATGMALEHAGGVVGVDIGAAWIPTVELTQHCETRLSAYDAVWIAPGSPYRSMTGALDAIRYCREADVPMLGTCGGCQHVAIEFARNVLGLVDAEHAEYDPYASRLIVTPLSCSLKGLAMEVAIDPDSRVAGIYGGSRVTEQYYCNFGLNPEYEGRLHEAGLRIVGRDTGGEARILTLPEHPFFVATLFVPQCRSSAARPHPLVAALVDAARAYRAARR